MSARNEGLMTVIKRGFGAVFKNFPLAFLAVAAYSFIDALLFQSILSFTDASSFSEIMSMRAEEKNSVLIKVILGSSGLGLMKSIFLGPLLAATVVYIGKSHVSGKRASMYGAVNFALSRYSRLFLPYMLAQISIQVGMIIVIPGVMFLMQYAFVDSVACLEDEKYVISRSKKLTRGRRRSLFLLILPWAIGTQVIGLLAFGESSNLFSLTLAHMLIESVYFVMYLCFFMLYDQRIRLLEELRAERKKQQESSDAEEASAGQE